MARPNPRGASDKPAPGLNPEQRQAVGHFRGPLLVLAGPGSGKTRVVTHRIARLLERGVEARQILAVTFTNKAAREMRERVRGLAAGRARGLTVATFHSACVRILRKEIEALGYGANFSIYDEASQHALMRTVLRDLKGAGATSSPSQIFNTVHQPPRPVAPAGDRGGDQAQAGDQGAGRIGAEAARSRADAGGGGVPAEAASPAADASDARMVFARTAFDRYREELRARNALDFEDLIDLTVRLFRERPEALARWRDRFRFVLVDEYQDTNAVQEALLELLAGEHRNLCVVGDDDQSIYGWRGAEVEHILDFPRRWPDARIVRLERNYRSTARIVALANAVASKSSRRHDKKLFTTRGDGDPVRVLDLRDEEEEADFIASEIAAQVREAGGNPWQAASRHAVLFRTNEQTRPLEQALRREKVPYRLLGGRSYFDRKEVLDVLAYLRVADNPADEEALLRVLNVPARGLGAKAVEVLRGAAREAGESLDRTLGRVAAGECAPGGLGPQAANGVRRFVEAIEGLRSGARARARNLVADLLGRVGYKDEVDRTYKDEQVRAARWALAREMQAAWETHLDGDGDGDEAPLRSLLEALALRAHDDGDDEAGGGVVLATVHSAKGLEFGSVYVAGVEEGFFPHARSVTDGRSLDEERRLFFVAVTRAQDRLSLTRAVTRTVRGKSAKTVPSRFLDDLPAEATERRDLAGPAAATVVKSHLERMRAALGK